MATFDELFGNCTPEERAWLLILAFLLRTTDLEPDDIVVREVS